MKSKYSISFTAGGLLYNETMSLLPVLKDVDSIKLLTNEAKKNEVLMINSESARKRVITEIKKRYKSVDKRVWENFDSFGKAEQKILLYYICLKTYKLLFDFHFSVLIEKWATGDKEILVESFSNFLEVLGSKDENVFSWTEKTLYKGAQVAVLMLKESGFIENDNLIKPHIDQNILKLIIENGDDWITDVVFLDMEDRNRLMQEM